MLGKRCGNDGAMGTGSCGAVAQARVGRDFVKQNFLHFMINPGQWGNSIYDGCQKTASSHRVDVELRK